MDESKSNVLDEQQKDQERADPNEFYYVDSMPGQKRRTALMGKAIAEAQSDSHSHSNNNSFSNGNGNGSPSENGYNSSPAQQFFIGDEQGDEAEDDNAAVLAQTQAPAQTNPEHEGQGVDDRLERSVSEASSEALHIGGPATAVIKSDTVYVKGDAILVKNKDSNKNTLKVKGDAIKFKNQDDMSTTIPSMAASTS